MNSTEGAVKIPRSSEKSTVGVYPADDWVSALKTERGRESRALPERYSRKGTNHPEAGEIPAAFHQSRLLGET